LENMVRGGQDTPSICPYCFEVFRTESELETHLMFECKEKPSFLRGEAKEIRKVLTGSKGFPYLHPFEKSRRRQRAIWAKRRGS